MAAVATKYFADLLVRYSFRPSSRFGSIIINHREKPNNSASRNGTNDVCIRPFHTTVFRRDIFNVQDADDFKETVLKSTVPVIVDFHATWCGPCKMLAPRLESLMTAHHGKIHLAKVDVDENTELAMEYDVTAVPAVIAFKCGKIQDRFIGLQDEDQIKSFIDKLI